jgi:diguanylate cyclase (GGDEF)-like protein
MRGIFARMVDVSAAAHPTRTSMTTRRRPQRLPAVRRLCALILGASLALTAGAYWMLERTLGVQAENAARIAAFAEQKVRAASLGVALQAFSDDPSAAPDPLRRLLLEAETAHHELSRLPAEAGEAQRLARARLADVSGRALALARAAKPAPADEAARRALAEMTQGEWLPALTAAQNAEEEATAALMRRLTPAKFGMLAAIAMLCLAEALLVVRPLTRALDRAAEDLRRLAEEDSLTGLATRGAFLRAAAGLAEAARAKGQRLALVLFDVDRLRAVNHAFGAAAGDAAIAHVARHMQAAGVPGTLAARWDGEELVALLTHGQLPAAIAFAETVRRTAADTICMTEGNRPLYLTISAGVALFDPAQGGIVEAIMRAEQNLRRAKRAGRNRVLFGLEDAAGEIAAA